PQPRHPAVASMIRQGLLATASAFWDNTIPTDVPRPAMRNLLSLYSLLILHSSPLAAGSNDLFEKHVRPVLVENCLSCHGTKKQMGGLRLDSREAMLKGGDNGPVIVPGDP